MAACLSFTGLDFGMAAGASSERGVLRFLEGLLVLFLLEKADSFACRHLLEGLLVRFLREEADSLGCWLAGVSLALSDLAGLLSAGLAARSLRADGLSFASGLRAFGV